MSSCSHCEDNKYVLVYWLEKLLERNGHRMSSIPGEVFKKIPLDELFFCHCHPMIVRSNKEFILCRDCEDTTWRFTEEGEKAGYRWKKVSHLSQQEIKELPCEYFERCPCGIEEQIPKSPERKKSVKLTLDFLKIPLPRLGF